MRKLLETIVISFIAGAISTHALAQTRAQILSSAWDAFNKERYDDAIQLASSCVDQFGRQAKRDQERLEASKAPLPPNGTMDQNSPQAKLIFANGILNDASACMFILAKSQDKSSHCSDARKAYEDLSRMTYARIWAPQGWFWVPSDSAADELAKPPGHC